MNTVVAVVVVVAVIHIQYVWLNYHQMRRIMFYCIDAKLAELLMCDEVPKVEAIS